MNFSSYCSQIYCLALQFFTKSFDVYIEFSFHFHFHCLRQRHILSTFCSIIKLCINKDNPLVPLQSATPISCCRMRKSIKLPVRVEYEYEQYLDPNFWTNTNTNNIWVSICARIRIRIFVIRIKFEYYSNNELFAHLCLYFVFETLPKINGNCQVWERKIFLFLTLKRETPKLPFLIA